MFSRIRWKPIAVFAAVALAAGVVVSLLVGKVQKRTEYVGKVDAATGYQFRLTLSPAWRHEKDSHGSMIENSPGDAFTTPTTNPIRQWIATHLFHQTATAGNARSLSLYLFQTTLEQGWYLSGHVPFPMNR